MARLPPTVRRPLRDARFRRGRTPGLRTAKTTLAAVVAYVVADALETSPQPLLAPLTALLVVQLTLYETFRHGLERIFSVLAGCWWRSGSPRWSG